MLAATLARRLWVTAGGTLVVGAANGVFAKSPAASAFALVTAGPVEVRALGGSGDLVRFVTPSGAVFQLDFADEPAQAQQVNGLSIPDCTALTRFATGWAFATGRDGVDTAVEVVGDDDTRRRFSIPLAGTQVKAFAPSPKGVFAAVRGLAEIPVLGSMPGGDVPRLPTRVTNELETVTPSRRATARCHRHTALTSRSSRRLRSSGRFTTRKRSSKGRLNVQRAEAPVCPGAQL